MPQEETIDMIHKIQDGHTIEELLCQTGGTSSQLHPVPNDDSVYEDFYHLLHSRPEEDFDRILRLVKSGYDVRATLRHIQEADLLLQISLKPEHRRRFDLPYNPKWPEFLRQEGNPYLGVPLHEPNQLARSFTSGAESHSIFNVPFHGVTLIEPRLTDARISKWTTITSDETLLINLMEYYFLHGYTYLTFFQKDLFLKDLKSGQNQFCSSLLVHAVLASATHYHPLIQGRNKPWDTQSLSYRFFAEAKRLWELEMGRSKLTTLQAALVMNSIYNMDGLDQIGNVFLVEAAKIAHNLDLFIPSEGHQRSEMDVARQFTAWCLFSWQS
ncbi:hypothetical protein ACHAPI_010086 [Fusarium lateritium]